MKKIIFPTLLIALLAWGCKAKAPKSEAPNILVILMDDMGYSDIGCYGGEVSTPNIDGLAEQGIRFTQFYNTAKCMSSRASLLTGLYAQQCEMAVQPDSIKHGVTLGEVLRKANYRTLAAGKHHGTENLYERGFDHYYGLRDGACNYWNPGKQITGQPKPGNKGRLRYWCDDDITYSPYTPSDSTFYTTDAYTDKALAWLEEQELEEQPFFLYLAYQAPHYPLHAWPEDIAKYKGKYDDGYAAIQKKRYERMVTKGIIDPAKAPLNSAALEKKWEKLSEEEREKETLRMEIYAAMIDRADQNIGRVLEKLQAQNKLDNTLVLFMSDNGACHEMPKVTNRSTAIEDFGTVSSYEVVGKAWATAQNTPLHYWKSYSHEGGICTPFIMSWPDKIKARGSINASVAHLIDIMPTLLELSGAPYPQTYKGKEILPLQGMSLLPTLDGQTLKREQPLFWKYNRGGAIRVGDMKAVFYDDVWELYNMKTTRNESYNLAKEKPQELERLREQWQSWYDSVTAR